MKITSTGKTADIDIYRLESIGIRTISISGNMLLLNRKQIYLHGVDKHEGVTCNYFEVTFFQMQIFVERDLIILP
jgi:hypothetical protein